jgi:hypothetical protein
MLSRILSLLGWQPAKTPKAGPRRPVRPRSATAHLFEQRTIQPPSRTQPPPAAADDFNPYNTGKFDRSASWERISKNQR